MKKALKITLTVVITVLVLVVIAGIIFIRETTEFGQIGDDVYFAVNSYADTVVIYGNGEMWDYDTDYCNVYFDPDNPDETGWGSPLTYHYADEIKTIIFMDGITYISSLFLYGCDTVEAIYIPETVDNIAYDAFHGLTTIHSIHFEGDPPIYDADYASDFEETSFDCYYTNHFAFWYGGCTIYYEDGSSGWDHEMWDYCGDCAYIEQNYRIPWLSILFGNS